MKQASVVNVEIAGEEYAIRTQATEEYTIQCAEHVDRKIAEIIGAGAIIQSHKAGILAALAVSDELFQARREVEALRAEIERRTTDLTAAIEKRLGDGDLAAGT